MEAVTVNQAAELKPYERIQKEMDFEGFTEGDWLKYALMFLLRNQNSFTKFCNYGCWCLPEDSGTVGYGKPVDAIDAACKEYTTCFNCVHKQESCDEELYKMTGKMDNGERYLLCMDPIGSCKRNRCECDLELAKKIAGREKVWNASYHREFGESPSAGRN
uniref:Phospholipase A2-like protein n=1 Tax=Oikopleura dioica TaxID=34765 RepID=Q8WPM8_OIKDI|nr:phospholipase A2-like protein [Oikopleura dioica]